jgi:hypothetical protein
MLAPLVILVFMELYCMIPFEEKGDFGWLGTGVVNGLGSLAFLIRVLVVSPVVGLVLFRNGATPMQIKVFWASFFTPLATLAMFLVRYQFDPLDKFMEAYLLGPPVGMILLHVIFPG